MNCLTRLWGQLVNLWNLVFKDPIFGALSEEEYEEFEFLRECRDWRGHRLTRTERERYDELYRKRGIDD